MNIIFLVFIFFSLPLSLWVSFSFFFLFFFGVTLRYTIRYRFRIFFPLQFKTHVCVFDTWARIELKTKRNVPIDVSMSCVFLFVCVSVNVCL